MDLAALLIVVLALLNRRQLSEKDFFWASSRCDGTSFNVLAHYPRNHLSSTNHALPAVVHDCNPTPSLVPSTPLVPLSGIRS